MTPPQRSDRGEASNVPSCGCKIKLHAYRGPWLGGSYTGGPEIEFCPMHASAGEMLQYLRAFSEYLDKNQTGAKERLAMLISRAEKGQPRRLAR